MSQTIMSWLLIGLLTGLLASRILPQRDPGGRAACMLIGIAGALLAFYVASLLGMDTHLGWAALAAALTGAAALLLVYRGIAVRRG